VREPLKKLGPGGRDMGQDLENRLRRLRELEELFRPALKVYRNSYAERLLKDEGLPAEVRKRFEEGSASGRFPALMDLLSSGFSDEEVKEFFRTGWMQLATPPPRPEKPWDHPPWNGNFEAYSEDLYAGMGFARSDLRAFAQEWLEELACVGYYGVEESLGLPVKQQANDFSPPRLLPLYGGA
jgi:hypothetical protein